MENRTLNPTLKQPFETRLLRYSLAIGALAAAPSAHASIISVPLNTIITTSNSPFDISLDGAGTDLTITLSGTSSGSPYSGAVNAAPSAGDALSGVPLAFGAPINLGDPTVTVSQILLGYSSSGSNTGSWVSQPDAFLGVQFTSNSQQYLGWVHLQVATGSATLLGYAYNDQAGQSINAGDTGATPEPASLSLFALGAAGVLALRRRQALNRSVRRD